MIIFYNEEEEPTTKIKIHIIPPFPFLQFHRLKIPLNHYKYFLDQIEFYDLTKL